MPENYDSAADTLDHSQKVGRYLGAMITDLLERSYTHDASKLAEPEKAAFDRCTQRLRGMTYGSEEYKASLAELGPALEHHYAHNRHHPEFNEPGLEWRPIKGFEEHYEVNNYGDVRSVDRVVKRDGTQGDVRLKGQPIKHQITPKGYLRVSLTKDRHSRNFMAHRLVAETFLPNPDAEPEVNHRNGNKKDNRVTNLEWATTSENQVHAYDTGLKDGAIKYVVHCPELDITAFGTEAMEKAVRERGYPRVLASGIWSAMDRGGKHWDLTFEGTLLAEWQRDRLSQMTIIDLMEMLADWYAASQRHDDGDLARSLVVQQKRFGISDGLMAVLESTARQLGWLEE